MFQLHLRWMLAAAVVISGDVGCRLAALGSLVGVLVFIGLADWSSV